MTNSEAPKRPNLNGRGVVTDWTHACPECAACGDRTAGRYTPRVVTIAPADVLPGERNDPFCFRHGYVTPVASPDPR